MADLTVTITESVTLNGAARGSTNTLTVAGVDDVYHRIITVPANVDTTLVNFHATVGASDSSLDVENVKYIRCTNLDSSNPINLSLQVDVDEDDSAADASATILLEAGKSFIMGSPSDGIAVDDDAATIITTLNNLESIIADSAAAAVQMEVFVASVVA
jgi:hypothetical protein|tara:strand:- start:1292 stop:1768 length:477 start_codon:yes stop_codon:yes gene_type:complete